MSYYCNECDAPFEELFHKQDGPDDFIDVCPYCHGEDIRDVCYEADMVADMARDEEMGL